MIIIIIFTDWKLFIPEVNKKKKNFFPNRCPLVCGSDDDDDDGGGGGGSGRSGGGHRFFF
mgnify:CR=1 FL=1